MALVTKISMYQVWKAFREQNDVYEDSEALKVQVYWEVQGMIVDIVELLKWSE